MQTQATEPETTTTEQTEQQTEAPRTCECGCGGHPRGKKSRFLPGHDAKAHGARLAEARKDEPERTCKCGCGGHPRGRHSDFLPGHDARWYAAIERAARAAAAAEANTEE